MHKDAKKMTKRIQVKTVYTDHLQESEVSFMLPIYLTRITKVEFIDTGEVVSVNTNDKNVYGYLTGIGYNQGYNSIYPNVEQISYHLGISKGTVNNSLKTLEKIKLIKKVRTKQKGKWDSTHYWVYRPNMIDRVRWLDINGDLLSGRHYRFDYKQFKKSKSEIKGDKLLAGLVTLQENEMHKEDAK